MRRFLVPMINQLWANSNLWKEDQNLFVYFSVSSETILAAKLWRHLVFVVMEAKIEYLKFGLSGCANTFMMLSGVGRREGDLEPQITGFLSWLPPKTSSCNYHQFLWGAKNLYEKNEIFHSRPSLSNWHYSPNFYFSINVKL